MVLRCKLQTELPWVKKTRFHITACYKPSTSVSQITCCKPVLYVGLWYSVFLRQVKHIVFTYPQRLLVLSYMLYKVVYNCNTYENASEVNLSTCCPVGQGLVVIKNVIFNWKYCQLCHAMKIASSKGLVRKALWSVILLVKGIPIYFHFSVF